MNEMDLIGQNQWDICYKIINYNIILLSLLIFIMYIQ